ncbi:MAG: oligosaccharide flippase family protein [Euryarchaeota archaeon]|nr:oligosaccharide flippase family protein [Euryarchaeota archaeon]
MGIVKGLVRRVASDELFRHSAVLFVLITAANALNYLFQLIMARMLTPAEFGVLGVLLSMFLLVAVPMGALQTGVAHFAATRQARSADHDMALFSAIRASCFGLAICTTLGLAATSGLLGGFLKVNTTLVALVGAGIGTLPITTFYAGQLQGNGRFIAFGASPLSGALARVGVAIPLVMLGMGLWGAIGGTLVGLLAALLAAAALAPRRPLVMPRNLGAFGRYVGPSMLAFAGLAAMTNLDMVAVKYFFDADQAGLYAGAVVLGRMMLFLPSAIGMVLFPLVAKAEPSLWPGLLLRALLATSALVGAVVVTPWANAPLVARFLLGENFVAAANLLRWMSLSMFAMCLVSILVLHLLATRRLVAACCLSLLGLLELPGFWLFHESPTQILFVAFAVGFLSLTTGLAWSFGHHGKSAPARGIEDSEPLSNLEEPTPPS